MKKIYLFAFSMLLIMAACKKDEDPKLSLDQSEITLHHNTNATLKANMDCTWSTSDAKVATVSTTGLVTGVRIGDAKIIATTNGLSTQCTVHVTAVSTLFKEPYYVYGASVSLTKSKESRSLLSETATGLIYYGENQNVRYVMYMFTSNAMTSAIVLLQNSTSVATEVVTFMTERYAYEGYSDGIYMFSDGKGIAMGINVDDSLGLNVIYINYPAKKSGSLLDQFRQAIKKFK